MLKDNEVIERFFVYLYIFLVCFREVFCSKIDVKDRFGLDEFLF